MENLKENLAELIKLTKANSKLEEANKTMIFDYDRKNKTMEELLAEDKIVKENKKKIELNDVKRAIIKNNIHYLFKVDFEELKAEMIDFYENKKIGDKTKEKMQNIIKKYFKTNFDVNVACYISFVSNYSGPAGVNFSFDFLTDDGYKSFILEYHEGFDITFEKKNFNNYELTISYQQDIDEYIELANLNKKAKELLKEMANTQAKIEKLRLQQQKLYHNFNDNIHGFVYNKLALKSDLSIY